MDPHKRIVVPISMDERTTWLYDNASFDEQQVASWGSRAEAGTENSWLCWALVDLAMLLVIVPGNVLSILAVWLSRRLRKLASNRLISSLALSDLLVGLSLLYHLFFFLDASLGARRPTCLLRFVLLAGGCCASFLNLTAIALDRYLSIVHPLKYTEGATERFVWASIGCSWCCAALVSLTIVFWNNYEPTNGCELLAVVPRYFIVLVLAPLFVTVWLSILILYWKIWREAQSHAQRWKMNGFVDFDSSHRKGIQVVLLVLGCFSVCWLPYVILAIIQVITPRREPSATVYRVMFGIAMSNSGIDPIIYAWKNASFRKAFHRLLRLRHPDHNDFNSSFKNYLRKQSELSKKDFELANAKIDDATADCLTSAAINQPITQSTAC